jgi:Ca2+-binding EF-hand superfamily protein
MTGVVCRLASVVGLALVVTLAAHLSAEDPRPAEASDQYDLIFFGENKPILVRLHVRIDDKSCTRAWNEFLEYLFKQLDKDGDGVLTLAEAESMPAPQDLTTGDLFAGANKVNLKRVDVKPRDDKITLDEFQTFFQQNAPPFQITFTQGQGNTAETLNEVLFKLLDADKDGKLAKEELAAARELMKRDVDDDEILGADELDPNRAPASPFVVQEEMQPERPMRPNQPRAFALVQADDKAKTWRQDLQKRYGKADGRLKGTLLGREELGLDEAAFKVLDKDSDGVLDNLELANFTDRPADVEVAMRLGQRGGGEQLAAYVSAKPPTLNGQLRAGKQGQLTLSLGTTLLEFRCRDAGKEQARINGIIAKQTAGAQFKALDRDNNGYLEMEEINNAGDRPGLAGFAASFKRIDVDGDGKVFEKEFLAYLDKVLETQSRAVASRAVLAIADQGRGLFDLLDTNQDGRLTLRELNQATNVMSPADRDGDGYLTTGEIPRTYQLLAHRDPASGNRLGRAVVVVARAGGPNRPRQDNNAGPVWFRKMDRNGDGDVSQREFLGNRQRFEQIDADQDGLISAEEAQKADDLLRKKP